VPLPAGFQVKHEVQRFDRPGHAVGLAGQPWGPDLCYGPGPGGTADASSALPSSTHTRGEFDRDPAIPPTACALSTQGSDRRRSHPNWVGFRSFGVDLLTLASSFNGGRPITCNGADKPPHPAANCTHLMLTWLA